MSAPNEHDRYSRQIRFREIGEEGQLRLAQARVAVVGCGALGSTQAELLARAGIGFLRLIDRDYLEWSNLQRQSLYDEKDAAEALPKAVAAAARLKAVNSSITVEPAVSDLTPANIDDLLEDVDLVMDGTDNFETRFLINDFALSKRIPWIYGAAVGSYGLKMPVVPGQTCCLRCMVRDIPGGAQETCETAGVIAPITVTIAALQVADALVVLTGHREQLAKKLTIVDVWTGDVQQMRQPDANPNCPACGKREFTYLTGKHRAPISLCGRCAVQIHDRDRHIDLKELANRLQSLGPVKVNDFALRAQIDGIDMTVFPDGRAILKGTTDVGMARSLYSKYVGN
jgi:molybdopterin/thiamine biosynthesis adenylyltransferase